MIRRQLIQALPSVARVKATNTILSRKKLPSSCYIFDIGLHEKVGNQNMLYFPTTPN